VTEPEKVEAAIRQSEEDAEVLQAAIINGHLSPPENAAALAALQRQSLTTQRLLLTVGEGKYVKVSTVRPVLAFAYTLGGAIIAIGVTVISGRIG
jgi:hypothetical protein